MEISAVGKPKLLFTDKMQGIKRFSVTVIKLVVETGCDM